MNNRLERVDILRGIAALCVVLGHAIQRGMVVGYENNILFKFIYTFHMPLFILLAGYTLFLSSNKFDIHFLIKKAKRLLYPAIVWSYLIYFFRDFSFVGIKPFIGFPDSILEYTKTLIIHPNYIIWFLYVLFIFNLIFYISKKLPEKFFLPSLLTIYLVLIFLPKDYFGVYQISLYFPFFVAGYYLSKYRERLIFKWYYLFVPAITYFIIFFHSWSLSYVGEVRYYLMALSTIILVYYLTKLKIPNLVKRGLSLLGVYSLELYLVQCLILNISIGTGFMKIISIFLFALCISLVIIAITNKSKISKLILFGK